MTKRQLYKYAGNRCMHCGKSIPDVLARYGTLNRLFNFHHVEPEQKAPSYDNLIRRNLSTEQLDEIDKCVLLCSFCHQLVHSQNRRVRLRLTSTVQGKSVHQELPAWLVSDYVQHTNTVLTAERVHIIPLWVHVGSQPPTLQFGTHFRKTTALVELLRNAAAGDPVEVRTYFTHRLLLSARPYVPGHIKISQHVAFNFLNGEFKSETGISHWMRNGYLLSSDGNVFTSGVLTATVRLTRNEGIMDGSSPHR